MALTSATATPPASKTSESPQSVPAQNAASVLALSPEFDNNPSFHGFTGRSPVMRQLILQMQRMAPHLTVATLEGEEGTGRSLAARALHAAGPVAASAFVPCLASQFFAPETALPEENRALAWSLPLLRQAHRGMLFLDAVHLLSILQQNALSDFLHWFDDRHYQLRQARNGSSAREPLLEEEALPTQLVFSSAVPLRHPGARAGLREDLTSRLCAVRFRLPSLSERREDIPLLAHIFIQNFARMYGKTVRGLGPGTMAPLLRYPWPGNVRELEHAITAAALETESQWIRPIDLPPLPGGSRQQGQTGAANPAAEGSADSEFNLDCAIRNHVRRVLSRTRGNKLRAAQLLGISRSTLYRILAAPESPPEVAGSSQAPSGPLFDPPIE